MRRWLAALFVLLVAAPAGAQVAFVRASAIQECSGTITCTITAFDMTGADFLSLVVGAEQDGDNQTCASATANGAAMTEVADQDSGGNTNVCYYQLAGASTGNVVITFTTSGPPAAWMVAKAFSGVDSGTPVGTAASGLFDNTTDTKTPTGTATGMCDDIVAMQSDQSASLAPGGSQTSRGLGLMSSNTAGTSTRAGATSCTMVWTWTNMRVGAHIAVPINASAGGGGSTPKGLLLLGVGEGQ